jgi:cyclophilin family peptidyl-prolyl cis-trans isomerase
VKRLAILALLAVSVALPSCQVEKVTEKGTDKLPEGPNPIVEFKTSMGDFQVELFESRAPITVKNFLGYADEKFFDGTIFHRVIPDFMVQAGGFDPGMKKKGTRAPIKSEADNNLPNLRGTLAMGLLPGQPNSGTSQFYVNLKHNKHLDGQHTVFGAVRGDGMDVVEKIAAVRTHNFDGHEAVPVTDVVILAVRRVEAPKTDN